MSDQPQNMTFYQVLEIDAHASNDEIEAAYSRLLDVLAPRSLALYSIPDDSEIARLRELVHEAYRTLKNPDQRKTYDQVLLQTVQPDVHHSFEHSFLPKKRRVRSDGSVEVNVDTEFSGAMLKRLRESCQLSLEELAEITKISRRYLTAIEENDYSALPAPVYVRGFVSEYARVLNLDATIVCKSYMGLYQRFKSNSVTP